MSYTQKIMRLELSVEKPTNSGYYYTELLLPAEDYEIRDAMQQLRAVGREDTVWVISMPHSSSTASKPTETGRQQWDRSVYLVKLAV